MTNDFLDFLKKHVPEYNTHLKLYGSIGTRRIKKMLDGELLDCSGIKPEPFNMTSTEFVEFNCYEANAQDVLDSFITVFLNALSTIENRTENFVEIVNTRLGGRGLEVSYKYKEKNSDYELRLKEYNKVLSTNNLAPLVIEAYKVFVENNTKVKNQMRKLRIQKQIQELNNELKELENSK